MFVSLTPYILCICHRLFDTIGICSCLLDTICTNLSVIVSLAWYYNYGKKPPYYDGKDSFFSGKPASSVVNKTMHTIVVVYHIPTYVEL